MPSSYLSSISGAFLIFVLITLMAYAVREKFFLFIFGLIKDITSVENGFLLWQDADFGEATLMPPQVLPLL